MLATFTTRAATLLLTAALCTPAMAGSARRADIPEPEPASAKAGKTLPPKAGEVLVEIAVASAADLMGAGNDEADSRGEAGVPRRPGFGRLGWKPDCSHFVHMVYSDAGLDYPYEDSRVLYRGTREFVQVKKPQPGDLIVWPGHVGIVVSRHEKTFFSSVRSGILTESWTAPHWLARGRPRFFRYRVTADTDMTLLASATREREADTYRGSADTRRKKAPETPATDDEER